MAGCRRSLLPHILDGHGCGVVRVRMDVRLVHDLMQGSPASATSGQQAGPARADGYPLGLGGERLQDGRGRRHDGGQRALAGACDVLAQEVSVSRAGVLVPSHTGEGSFDVVGQCHHSPHTRQ
uniref:Uncharacterized protein n=1 Tax=uncultured marine virus TaxID=186617 RepID=A0A0F7L3G1_9VIRU|nr:hypothetical protein [uncultured marine virus]